LLLETGFLFLKTLFYENWRRHINGDKKFRDSFQSYSEIESHIGRGEVKKR
jgi:hypothetical protein